MSAEQVQEVRAAGVRARALRALIEESIRRKLNMTAAIAQSELRDLEETILTRYDVRL